MPMPRWKVQRTRTAGFSINYQLIMLLLIARFLTAQDKPGMGSRLRLSQ